jgi:hypothetical protein
LEKIASALEVPLYRLFTDGAHAQKPNVLTLKGEAARNKKEEVKLRPCAKALSWLNDKDRKLLLHMASRMAKRG